MQRRLKLTGLAALLAVGIGSAPLFAAVTGGVPANGPTTNGMPIMGGGGSSMAGTSSPRQVMAGHMMDGGMMGIMGMMSMIPRMNQMMATGNEVMQRMIAYRPPVGGTAPAGGAARSK